MARVQVGHWKNTSTLFIHALNVTSDNWLAHTKIGNELYARGDLADTSVHCEEALRIDPGYVEALNNLGTVRHGRRTQRPPLRFSKRPSGAGFPTRRHTTILPTPSSISAGVNVQPTLTDINGFHQDGAVDENIHREGDPLVLPHVPGFFRPIPSSPLGRCCRLPG
jgi:hypothetical protein